ncbi:NAD(P)/FAD-dependent oxidoreductase [Allorhodopirellula solitaria]|uniref:Protoporphyrinogen oxidase n=1 Tax=Allorhodopirellula solitaria TaxID=2527987 RepID=A0A5C5XNX2_9BACT|nr:FAD-dependent oxidoreductase [Allorhodopirellula solitaria]TWT64887.1 protoporphyrinogen oxidase [Allorhodopirellula solitaria]
MTTEKLVVFPACSAPGPVQAAKQDKIISKTWSFATPRLLLRESPTRSETSSWGEVLHIAIIGSGISGLVCARLLSRDHDVTVFESAGHVGGHAHTVSIDLDGQSYDVDTGFLVYNDRTYPVFSQMLRDLCVDTVPTSMSFSVRCDRSGLEYNGTSLNGIFAQRQNSLRPTFWKMLRDIGRFNRNGSRDFSTLPDDLTVGDYLTTGGYSAAFAQQYLLPMGAAIWSCPREAFLQFPIRFILEFYHHHGLLSLTDRPIWRTVAGGSKHYVDKLISPFRDKIRCNHPVSRVRRMESEVIVSHVGGSEAFDEVIFACHSDQALRLLDDPDELETELLTSFPYSDNTAVLHTDSSILPQRRRAWASWNYRIFRRPETRPTVTYLLNHLQGVRSPHSLCVTLNAEDMIDPAHVLRRFRYSHPVFTTERAAVQQQHGSVIRRRRTSYCGAYWRNGFHEDGVVSGLAVCRRFGIPGWSSDQATLHRPATVAANRDAAS